ncbi:hypothetical protein QAD02_012107 [Eretmocerus hayati]|uniref:Uncharacterized protein n=1 Tax=Eretmocerus hayati TaxID=131215 RepID=A0ACC2P3I6_9HYME|nr:hypothetical protein QAD02_012107 [Eretmocerus hayati]
MALNMLQRLSGIHRVSAFLQTVQKAPIPFVSRSCDHPCSQEQCMKTRDFHTSLSVGNFEEPKRFLRHNKKVYPPQGPDEEPRPAFVCHQKCNIRYSPKKMTYVTWFVRGMSVDEAIKQLSFVPKKGAGIVKETILEAQRLAVEQHNVEFKSNLWVAESFCSKAFVVKGRRKHAKGRSGEVRYTFCHYFVRLEEGKPPKDYYKHDLPETAEEMIDRWKIELRSRKIENSL